MGVALEKLCRERHDGDGQDEQRKPPEGEVLSAALVRDVCWSASGYSALTRSVHPHATRHTGSGSLISFIHAQYLKRVVANVGV